MNASIHGERTASEPQDRSLSVAHSIEVPSEIIRKWQEVVNLLAEIMQVPSASIMRVDPPHIKIFVSSTSEGNPCEPGALDTGPYCETVMKTGRPLLVPDALENEAWKANPHVRLGMISYLGVPITWPDGSIFGTICVRDNKRNEYSEAYLKLLLHFRDILQADLKSFARLHGEIEVREAKIRRLVDSNIIGIFTWDFDGRILEANEAFLRIVGYDHEDLVAGSIRWTDLTPPEWRDRDTRLIQDHKATGFLQPFEKEYFRKDGSRVPVLIGVATFEERDDQGVAFVLDLTERKRAEERLRVQHTVAQILAQGATIEEVTPRMLQAIGECLGWDVGALWRVDREARALRCVEFWHKGSIEVPEFERLSRDFTFVPGLGLPGRVWSRLEPQYINDVVLDENFPRVAMAEREGLHAAFGFPILLGGEALGVIEFFSREIRRPDQQLLNMLATIGSQIGQFMERKRAEQALRRGAAWLAQAQRLSHIGTWVMNGTTRRFLYWSNESYRIWGFNPLQGLPSREDFWGRIHPDDRERVWGKVHEAMREQRDFFAEFRILLPDGTVKHLEANTRHEFSPQGALLEVLCTSVDVTERKRAQDEHEKLRQLESDLAHMNRLSVMGELTASLAHEITQPIASARNNARAAQNFLNEQAPDLDEVREALGCVVADADRAGEIVDRIRDQVKKAPPRKEHFDLNAAINEVMVLARNAIMQNEVSVQTLLAEGLFSIHGDRVQLQQAVLNLLLNAVEAMGSVDGGPRELLISTEQVHKSAVVAVRDTGPGIDPERMERVFDAFYTTKPTGVGMGLSICRSIIDAYGGRLWVDANEPRGTVFQFTLPCAES
jgi:PAS domain S-box-containing protein